MYRAKLVSFSVELPWISQVCLHVSIHLRCGGLSSEWYHRSINESICHGIPDKRKLREGDIVNIGGILLVSTTSPVA